MSKPETTLVGFNDWCGQNLWEPLSRDVRTYFEGPEATRLPNPFERSLPERPWSMEYEDYWIAFGSAVLISVLSVLVGQCILQVSLNACPFDNQELTLNRVTRFQPLARVLQLRPMDYHRFRESSWQCLFYGPMWVYSLWIVWDAPWFTYTWKCYDLPYPFLEMR